MNRESASRVKYLSFDIIDAAQLNKISSILNFRCLRSVAVPLIASARYIHVLKKKERKKEREEKRRQDKKIETGKEKRKGINRHGIIQPRNRTSPWPRICLIQSRA